MKYKGIKQEQMTRTKVIQDLIDTHNLKSYLEIGVQESANGSQINCEYKVGVDIKKPKNAMQFYNSFYEGKSDMFFKQNKEQFDIIFIDGDHSHKAVYEDFNNAKAINPKFIVLHDAFPNEEEATKWPNKTQYGTYNGEVYKLLLEIHLIGKPYTLYTFDHGVLVIDMKQYNLIKDNGITLPKLTWELYSKTEFDGNQGLTSLDVAKIASTLPVYEMGEGTIDKIELVSDSVMPNVVEYEIECNKDMPKKVIEIDLTKGTMIKKRKPMSQATKDKIKATKAKNAK